ncbi:MAG TPA: hypothetical protein EYM81_07670 [Candidatus Poseidoniales archaeon]|nr:hypothetical protein [Candidatus Poseidoniales archaeon]
MQTVELAFTIVFVLVMVPVVDIMLLGGAITNPILLMMKDIFPTKNKKRTVYANCREPSIQELQKELEQERKEKELG